MGKDQGSLTELYCEETDIPTFKLYNNLTNELRDLNSTNVSPWKANSIKFIELYTLDNNSMPNEKEIITIYPNPFNPTTNISIMLEKDSYIKAQIIDLYGNVISELIDDNFPAGKVMITWNPQSISSGMYFVHMECENANYYQKVIYLK